MVDIGEAKDVCNRLKTHLNSPKNKIKYWDRAVIINEDRSALQSNFNDSVIRKSLELSLIEDTINLYYTTNMIDATQFRLVK